LRQAFQQENRHFFAKIAKQKPKKHNFGVSSHINANGRKGNICRENNFEGFSCHHSGIIQKVYKNSIEQFLEGCNYMGIFKKKQEEMELPPPPPPEEPAGAAPQFPDMPQEEDYSHIPSEMPEIKAEEAPMGAMQMTGAPIEPAAMPTPAEQAFGPAADMGEEKMMPSGTPYVDVSSFNEVMTNVGRIRDTLKEADERINRMTNIKNVEEKELEKWRVQLEEIERKLSFVDDIISKGE
jgi:hypothetical protein